MAVFYKIGFFITILAIVSCTQEHAAVIEYKTPLMAENKSTISRPLVIENEDGELMQYAVRNDDYEEEEFVDYKQKYAAVKVESLDVSENKIGNYQNHHIDEDYQSTAKDYPKNLNDQLKSNDGSNKYKIKESKIEVDNQKHIVMPKETLFSVAKKYDVNLKDLAEYNNIDNPYTIKVGQNIKIPKAGMVTDAKFYAKNDENLVEGDSVIPLQPKIQEQHLSKNLNNLPIPVKKQLTNKINLLDDQLFIWPVKGKILSNYGAKANGIYNDGINISAPKGSAVKAVADAQVVYTGNKLKGYGNLLILKHKNNYLTAYAHLEEIKVKKGEAVKQGAVIATVGDTGHVSTSQLHFGIRKGKEPVNPNILLKM